MATDDDKDFEAILERIREVRNFDFRHYKRATLRRRIERRMQERHCRSFADYGVYLEHHPDEYDAVISSMLIKVTSFFRDPETWDYLRDAVLPELVAQKKPGGEIRIWTAGCATGEESYSIAILVAEALGASLTSYDVKIFGTDVDEGAVAYARRGVYTAQQVESVPEALRQRWFLQTGEGFMVRKELRRLVVFGVNNLVSDAPISRLDLLLCRNVFIYLDATLQKRVLSRFHYSLRSHGVLVLGKSELIPFAAKIFQAIDLTRRVYRKDTRADIAIGAQDRLLSLLEQENVQRAVQRAQDELGVLTQFHSDILQSLPEPVIATSLDGTVTHWNAAAARLWSRTADEAMGKRLPTLKLPGLPDDIIEKTALVREGKSSRESAEGVIVRPDGTQVLLAIEVMPTHNSGDELVGVQYLVLDVSATRNLETDLRRANEERQSALEELQTTNEELQSANEELETTNEELQSANEELQTTNEELQSTNEELETTNEELQSTNAELDATNRELAARTEELNLLGFYQRTIIRSLAAAVIVLDAQGRITMWNLAAERLLGLPESEALGQIFWTLRVPAFSRGLVARVRRSLAKQLALRIDEIAYELPTGGRGFGNLAAIPLVESGNDLGSVLLFEDCTRASRRSRGGGGATEIAGDAPRKARKRR